MNEYIKTMLEQIKFNRMRVMCGISSVTYDNKNNSINFAFKMCKKANRCSIRYNDIVDDYEIKFWKLNSNYDMKLVHANEGLFFDEINKAFEEFTGLRTSL